ncbi:hypothetical protein [Georgenia yuyongxinii]
MLEKVTESTVLLLPALLPARGERHRQGSPAAPAGLAPTGTTPASHETAAS